MPFDGSGNYTPASPPNFPAIAGTTVVASYYNAVIMDLSTALSNVLTRDGQGKPSANISWDGKNLTNVGTFGAVAGSFTGLLTAGAGIAITGTATLGGLGLAVTVSPILTGTPTAPTAAPATSTTQIATTAFVSLALADYATLASPSLTGSPLAPTAAPGTNTAQIATTAFVMAAIPSLAAYATSDYVDAGLSLKANLASPALTGTPTTGGIEIGYRSIPRAVTSGTLEIGDNGKCVAITAGMTVPSAVFAAGDTVSLYNNTAGNLTITEGAGLTLRQAGSANAGNRILPQRGIATVWFNTASEAIITGSGLY